MTTTHTFTASLRRLSIRQVYSFALAILLTPLAFGQSFSTSSTPVAPELPDAPVAVAALAALNPDDSLNTAGKASVPANVYVFPAREERAHAYVYDLIGPRAFLAPAITAGVKPDASAKNRLSRRWVSRPGLHPAHGTVPEWGEGFDGYAKRYADSFGQGLLSTTGRYALGEILREDVTYHRCACTGAGPRAFHALSQAFIAHTQSGRGIPSIPAIVSPFAASEVAVGAWYPSRFNSSDALRVSIPLFVGVPVKNLVAEFKRAK